MLVIVLLLILTINLCICDTCIKSTELSDCLRISIFKHKIPPMEDDECNGNETTLIYSTELINEGMVVYMTIGGVVLKHVARNNSYESYCRMKKDEYNITLRIKSGSYPNKTSYDEIIENVLVLPEEFETLDHAKEIVNQMITNNYAVYLRVPPEPVRFYISLEYLHPVDDDKCLISFMLYSCWIKYLIYKIVGACLGVGFGMFVVTIIPIILMVFCCINCRKRRKVNS